MKYNFTLDYFQKSADYILSKICLLYTSGGKRRAAGAAEGVPGRVP